MDNQADLWTGKVESLCRKLVGTHAPPEFSLFDLVWQTFWEAMSCRTVDEMPDLHVSSGTGEIHQLGAISRGQFGEMDSLCIIAAISGVTQSLLKAKKKRLRIEDIQKAITTYAIQLQTPKHVQSILEKHAIGLLAEMFQIETSMMNGQESVSKVSLLYVDMLSKGEIVSQRISEESADMALENDEYDIVVHEPKGSIQIQNRDDGTLLKKVYEVSPLLQAMLWLTLRYAGSHFYFDDAKKIIGAGSTSDTSSVAQRFHQYRRRIATDLLGETLADEIFLSGMKGGYAVSAEGWAFCWIRRSKDVDKSELLKSIPSS